MTWGSGRTGLAGDPRGDASLYHYHTIARRFAGKKPDPIHEWARDRVGINGYEVCTAWIEELDRKADELEARKPRPRY